MKKILSLIFSMIIALMLFSGCAETEPNETDVPTKNPTESVGDVDDSSNVTYTPINGDDYIKNYDKEEFFAIGDSETKGFLLKGKKYEYYGNDVLILKVESKTDTAYSIKMKVTFYDESGEKIRSTNKNFEGFAAGWENYFVFQPNITFDSFDYEFVTKEYIGDVHSGLIEVHDCELEMFQTISWVDPHGQLINGDPYNRCVGIHAKINVTFSNEETLYYGFDYIFFDNKGDLYYLNTSTVAGNKTPPNIGDAVLQWPIYVTDILWKDKDRFVWPEELKGDISCILSIKAVNLNPPS